jgi:DNA-binding transcriptional MerR regulator
MAENSTVLTVGEAARRLERSEQTVRNYEARGKLKACARTSSGVRLFDPGDVERLAAELKK